MENSNVTCPSQPGSRGVTLTIIPHLAYVDFPKQITKTFLGILKYSTVLANTNELGGIIHSAEFLVLKFEVLKFLDPLPEKFKNFFGITINQKLLTKIYFDSKYDVFYEREKKSFDKLNKNKNMKLTNIDFNKITSLSKEILEKLNKHKPENLYDAGKISSITPSALFQIVKHKKVKGTKVA